MPFADHMLLARCALGVFFCGFWLFSAQMSSERKVCSVHWAGGTILMSGVPFLIGQALGVPAEVGGYLMGVATLLGFILVVRGIRLFADLNPRDDLSAFVALSCLLVMAYGWLYLADPLLTQGALSSAILLIALVGALGTFLIMRMHFGTSVALACTLPMLMAAGLYVARCMMLGRELIVHHDDFWKHNSVIFMMMTALAMVFLQVSLASLLMGHLFARIKRLSVVDVLTGLYNRRFMNETMRLEITRSARSGKPLSVILLDVDHFKQVNDVYGHLAGDEVLRQVGHVMQSVARRSDVCARWGGEEFCLLLPGAEDFQAVEIAERLRVAIAAQGITFKGHAIRVSASFGVAHLELSEIERAQVCEENRQEALVMLLQRADTALYAAKSSGRNLVLHIRDLGSEDVLSAGSHAQEARGRVSMASFLT